jgi:hypothetical protein
MSDDDSPASTQSIAGSRAARLWTAWIALVLACALWPLISRLFAR